jgi:U2 small nuclear ribonucleoprotein A'
MRITAEILSQAEVRTNPIQDRELVLRELGIRVIENMGTVPTTDFASLDLSNNRITVLENFARAPHITHLYCSGNLIERIDVNNLRSNLPNLVSLTLSYNNLTSLAEIANLATACPKLEDLSLVGNPVTRKYQRLIVVHGWFVVRDSFAKSFTDNVCCVHADSGFLVPAAGCGASARRAKHGGGEREYPPLLR